MPPPPGDRADSALLGDDGGLQNPSFLGWECGSHGGFSAPLGFPLYEPLLLTHISQLPDISKSTNVHPHPHVITIDFPWFQDGLWPRLPVHRVGLRETHEAGTGRRGGTQWRRRELWRGARNENEVAGFVEEAVFFSWLVPTNIVTSSKLAGWMKLNDLMIEKRRIDLMIWWLSIFLF